MPKPSNSEVSISTVNFVDDSSMKVEGTEWIMSKTEQISKAAFPAVSKAINDAVKCGELVITDSESLKYTKAYTGDAWNAGRDSQESFVKAA